MQMDATYSSWIPGSYLADLRLTTQYSTQDRQSFAGVAIKCRPVLDYRT